MNMMGSAENTAFVQSWLNSCPAVQSWKEYGNRIVFEYDPAIEVIQIPNNVHFDEADNGD